MNANAVFGAVMSMLVIGLVGGITIWSAIWYAKKIIKFFRG